MPKDSEAIIEVVAPKGAAQNFVYLEFFDKRWEVASARSEGGEWSETLDVSDYARWGVGLYKVVWDSRGEDGGVLCRSSATINVDGFPLATVAGAVGAVSIAIGLSALTFTLKTTINEGGRWAIKVVGKGEVERRQGDDGDGEMRLRVKPTLSGSQTLLGTLGGLLLGGGTLATLQETATSLPTIELALELVLPTTILGMLTGLFRLAKT